MNSQNASTSENENLNEEVPVSSLQAEMESYMARLDNHRSFDKQSAQVNGGLNVGSTFASGAPVVNIDFSKFTIPMVAAPAEKPSTRDIVRRLMNPSSNAFVHGVISMNWVMGAAGHEHFVRRPEDDRIILTQTSTTRFVGKAMGIPAAYHEWLCGDDTEISANEQGMLLTKDFFEKEV